MAQSRAAQQARSRTSIHGKRIGLTHDDYLVGPKQHLNVVTNATTSSSGTNLLNYGFHTINSSTDGNWVLDDPTPGCHVDIVSITASTNQLTFNNSVVYTTNGIASSSATFNAIGEAIHLVGVSTSQWACTSNVNAVAFSS